MDNRKENKNMGELALKALTTANAKLLLRSREEGAFLVIWREGKVCRVPASEIEFPVFPPDKNSES